MAAYTQGAYAVSPPRGRAGARHSAHKQGASAAQTLLTSSSVLLQTENVNIAQSELHEYDSMAGGPSAATAAAAARRTAAALSPTVGR